MSVREPGLDETGEPTELIVADLPAIDGAVGHLRSLDSALERGGRGLRNIDVDGWQGEAAEAFRARFDESPARWFAAADAFGKAAGACESFRHTVAWARQQAARAAELHRSGTDASASAVRDRNAAVDAYNTQVGAANAGRAPAPTPLPEFIDPGVAMLERAALMLSDARRSRDAAGADAARAVQDAAAAAPDPPSFWGRAGAEITDEFADVGRLLSGVGEGVEDIARTARSLNPLDPWNVTHPAAFVDGVSSTAAGLVTANLHPAELVKGVTGTGWGSDPAHALGKLIPGAALALATGGAGKVAAGVAERGVVPHAVATVARGPARTVDSPFLPARAQIDPRYLGEERGEAIGLPPGHRVHYFDDARREEDRLTVHNGLLHDRDGNLFSSTAGGSHWSPGQSRSIFVMDGKGNLYASNSQRVGELHHSSFLGGEPVAGAGEIGVADGRLQTVSDRSGHYRPPPECLDQVLGQLRREGMNLDGVTREGFGG